MSSAAHSIAEVQVRLDDRLSAKKTLDDAARKVLATSDAEFRMWDGSTMAKAQIDLRIQPGSIDHAVRSLYRWPHPRRRVRKKRTRRKKIRPAAGEVTWPCCARAGDLASGNRLGRR